MHLLINYYIDSDPSRQKELEAVLHANLGNRFISRIVIVTGFDPLIMHEKIVVEKDRERPTFRDMFKIANKYSKNGSISIIANSDIYFDDSLGIAHETLKAKQCYALSRWDIDKFGNAALFARPDSQDAWMFRGMIRDVPECSFTLGTAGCDNAIAERIERAGYELINPSVDIRAYHLHISGIRNYQAPKPYRFIQPTSIKQK